jgi:hypothetical protein
MPIKPFSSDELIDKQVFAKGLADSLIQTEL